ncbi:hypothetical protein OJAV_G00171550 [Oryzias javanicus]|uniref:Uncharacterized protein n=1 Tax=Oryzias javanicus TaxID=123683 RepID=A0A437CF60_ORYJA|nr:hypothetical protein OJAV_G00171550 [Oryzias javanicus]
MAVALDEVWGRVKNVCKQNGLLILSVLAVVIGCLLGFFLRGKQLSEQVGSDDRCSHSPPPASPASPCKIIHFPPPSACPVTPSSSQCDPRLPKCWDGFRHHSLC